MCNVNIHTKIPTLLATCLSVCGEVEVCQGCNGGGPLLGGSIVRVFTVYVSGLVKLIIRTRKWFNGISLLQMDVKI